MYLFVYGTMKHGFSNHIILRGNVGSCGTAQTSPHYALYDSGSFPCLVKKEPGKCIKGELYSVDNALWAKLDSLEGVPHLFKRESIKIKDYPSEISVFAYIYQQDISKFKECDQWPEPEKK